MKKRQLKIQDMALIAMFTAILSVLSQISFLLPGGIPITLQTFSVILAASILGSKSAPVSILLYLLVGSIGIPVFANFKGGIGVLFGPTGGFLIGFIFTAFLTGLGKGKKFIVQLSYMLLGLVACHICGLLVYIGITHTILPTIPLLFIKDTITGIFALTAGRQCNLRIKMIKNQY